MTTSFIEPQTRRVKANVGDMIQYFYPSGPCSRAKTTNRILEVNDNGASFIVTGFYMVEAKDVITVIPMHEIKVDCDDLACIALGRCICFED